MERSRATVGWQRVGLSGLLSLSWLWLGQAATPEAAGPRTAAELRQRLEAHLADARFQHADWGVQIVSLGSGRVVFSRNADKLFIPASNTKLFTGALALDELGAAFRIRTSLYGRSRPNARGELAGDLVVFGRGDPSVAARRHGGSVEQALAPLVRAVAGVRLVKGDLVMDETGIQAPPLGASWTWDDLTYYYAAEVSALSFNDNAVEVTVCPDAEPGQPAVVRVVPADGFMVVSNRCVTAPRDAKREVRVARVADRNCVVVTGRIPVGSATETESLAVHNPAAWFGERFRQALGQAGIRVRGNVRVVPAMSRSSSPPSAPDWIELGSISSPPLSELLADMMKPSQNLHAQLLLAQVGQARLDRDRRPGEGRWEGVEALFAPTAEEAGVLALGDFLERAGIPRDEVFFEEGSGLSRRHLVTPAAVCRLLQFMNGHREAEVYRAALPVAGVDGTLKSRMRATLAEGNARAKTGSLRFVYALSGFVTTAAGEPLAFAILLNDYRPPASGPAPRVDLDLIVTQLAGVSEPLGGVSQP